MDFLSNLVKKSSVLFPTVITEGNDKSQLEVSEKIRFFPPYKFTDSLKSNFEPQLKNSQSKKIVRSKKCYLIGKLSSIIVLDILKSRLLYTYSLFMSSFFLN